MKNGEVVAAFEREFAAFVGAKYAIALCNGTATLHTALVALGVKPGDRVAVPPLTMSATTIAALHAGAVPVFRDVDPRTWLMRNQPDDMNCMPVDLYGLYAPAGSFGYRDGKWRNWVYDSAQTLRCSTEYGGKLVRSFVSYSFQASKILALGEGGMLVTDDEALATRAREFSSLGYRMRADQPRIDPAVLKSPTYERHHSLGWNYRMNDATAALGLLHLTDQINDVASCDQLLSRRREAADMYRKAITDCTWVTPQFVPEGWTHDYWAFAVSCDTPARALQLADSVVVHGGERPYGAWRLTYDEPAFTHLLPREEFHDARILNGRKGILTRRPHCPVAESLQPRLLQFQTNNLVAAAANASALRAAIAELSA